MNILNSALLITLLLTNYCNIAFAQVAEEDEISYQGDFSITEGDNLRVTTNFNGTFSSISSVRVTLYLTDYYSNGESYRLRFFNDNNNVVAQTTHVKDSPFSDQHLGYLTNSTAVRNLFLDGNASFDVTMLSGSVNVSSVYISINGEFVPDPTLETTPVPFPQIFYVIFALLIVGVARLTGRHQVVSG